MSAGHGAPGRGDREPPLHDVSTPTPSHAERARTLLASIRTGALATLATDPAGHPYASFVTYALDGGHPVFLMSELAEHTRHLRADPRASMLVAESRSPDPLANGRVTLVGEARCLVDADQRAGARERFLAVHPGAAFYAGFGDFGFWRLEVSSVRYIGGYGRMSWVERDAFLAAEPDPLAGEAESLVVRLNHEHADALVLCCRAFTRAKDASGAVVTGVDRYGFELSVTTGAGARPVRLTWSGAVRTADDVGREVTEQIARARRVLG